MSPDRTFIAPVAAPRPKTKVALGAKRAAAKPIADLPITDVPDPAPTDASSGGGAAPDLPVTLGQSRRWKEKRQEAKIEEVLTLKRTKRPTSTRSSDLHEGLRERDALASTLVDQIRDKVPGMETIMGWSCNRLGEQIAEDILRMKDANSLARFICTDEAIAKEFLTAFINTEVGDKLTWVYGQWAFSSGCRAIQEQVHTALIEGLEETDLPAVMALLPDEVADPGPRPYSKPVLASYVDYLFSSLHDRGTLLPSASKAIRSAELRNRAPYSRDGHLAPIGLEGHKDDNLRRAGDDLISFPSASSRSCKETGRLLAVAEFWPEPDKFMLERFLNREVTEACNPMKDFNMCLSAHLECRIGHGRGIGSNSALSNAVTTSVYT
nr:serine/arginine repetitive matrix protein 2-like [Ipomoea batatas]